MRGPKKFELHEDKFTLLCKRRTELYTFISCLFPGPSTTHKRLTKILAHEVVGTRKVISVCYLL